MNTLRPRLGGQYGMTMVELLVGLAVGLFLSAGVLQIFLSTNQTYRSLDAGARVQENARYSLGTLARDIRMAGFMGCRSLAEGIDVAVEDEILEGLNMAGQPVALMGYEDGAASAHADKTWNGFLDFLGSGIERVDGTDVVQLLYAGGSGATVSSEVSSAAGSELELASNPDGLDDGELAFITDCANTTVFTIGGEDSALTHAGLDRTYAKGAMVFPVVARAYFVGTGGVGCPATAPCLYRWQQGVNPGSLVAGVEDLEISYGEDTNGDGAADEYNVASPAVDFGRVVSLRMGLVFSSEAEVTGQPRALDPITAIPYEDSGDDPPAADRKYRAPYWITVSLRNALP